MYTSKNDFCQTDPGNLDDLNSIAAFIKSFVLLNSIGHILKLVRTSIYFLAVSQLSPGCDKIDNLFRHPIYRI